MIEMIGAKNKNRAAHDFYATHPKHANEIAQILKIKKEDKILEPCAGNGHIAHVLKEYSDNVITNDLVKREYSLNYNYDFRKKYELFSGYDFVITNPPFCFLEEFILNSLKCIKPGGKVVVFARIQTLESKKRYEILKNHLEEVYVYSRRAKIAKYGIEENFEKGNSMTFSWFIFTNEIIDKPTISWII